MKKDNVRNALLTHDKLKLQPHNPKIWNKLEKQLAKLTPKELWQYHKYIQIDPPSDELQLLQVPTPILKRILDTKDDYDYFPIAPYDRMGMYYIVAKIRKDTGWWINK